jgi:hypothetical protein
MSKTLWTPDGPSAAGGIRAAQQPDQMLNGVRDMEQRWLAVPPGGTLRLC